MDEQEVNVMQMAAARERRVQKQLEMLCENPAASLLCFTMNIAGPVKRTALITRAFFRACKEIEMQFCRVKTKVLSKTVINEKTGLEAFFAVSMPPKELKMLALELENYGEVGRLYDMDVLFLDGGEKIASLSDAMKRIRKIERGELGFDERKCLICGKSAKECTSRRIHSVPELQKATACILKSALNDADCTAIASLAVRSLLYEVNTTPKPGLVDRTNNGSHKDMDIFTFMNSSAALYRYFEQCAKAGMETRAQPAPFLFSSIKDAAKAAERAMFFATGGVNTHKGAIFTLGILCAAISRVGFERRKDSGAILAECAAMTAGITERDFAGLTAENARTAGQKLYVHYGIKGVRGEAEAGFPAVKSALCVLESLLAQGFSANDAGRITLLHIIANLDDTAMISRSDVETQKLYAQKAEKLISGSRVPSLSELEALDRAFIEKNLSPGGSADLLSLCWMLHFVKTEAI